MGPRTSPQTQAKENVKKTMENPPEGSFGQAKRLCCTFASSFPLERSEMVTTDRDNRSAGNTFPVNFDPEGVGDGSSYY